MKSKKVIKRVSGVILLLASVILIFAGLASAALYHHTHTQAGVTNKTSQMVLGPTKLGMQAQAPSIGTLECRVYQDGVQQMHSDVQNGQCANEYRSVSQASSSREFRSTANITSGTAEAWLWTSGEGTAPLPCSQQGQND